MRSGAPRPRILWYPITRAILLLLCCSRLRSVLEVNDVSSGKVLCKVLSEVHLVKNAGKKRNSGDPPS